MDVNVGLIKKKKDCEETISVGRCVGAPGETGFEGEILRSKEHFYTEQEHWKKWTNFLRKHDPNKFRITQFRKRRKILRPLHREGLGRFLESPDN